MKNTGIKNKAGFTLVEMVLVVGLLAISFGVTSDILISLVRSQTKSRVMNGIEQQANFVSLSIEKELRNAVSVRRPHVSIGGSTIIIERRNIQSGHLYPLDRGGKHVPDNTFLMLARSNQLQGNLTAAELIDLMKFIVQQHELNAQRNDELESFTTTVIELLTTNEYQKFNDLVKNK